MVRTRSRASTTAGEETKASDTSSSSPRQHKKRQPVQSKTAKTEPVYPSKEERGVNEEFEESVENVNKHITKILTNLAKYHQAQGDRMRSRAYDNAVDEISKYAHRIESGEEASQLPGVGKGISDRIDEICRKGTCQEWEEVKQDPGMVALMDLTRVYGIGPARATNLIQQGILSVNQLKEPENQNLLNDAQLTGLKFVRELGEPIPRNRIEKIEKKILEEAKQQDMKAMICGAYRRGELSDDKIIVCLTHNNFEVEDPDAVAQLAKDTPAPKLLRQFVDGLQKQGVIVSHLIDPHSNRMTTLYRGVCTVPGEQKPSETEKRQFERATREDEPENESKQEGDNNTTSGKRKRQEESGGSGHKARSSASGGSIGGPEIEMMKVEDVKQLQKGEETSVPGGPLHHALEIHMVPHHCWIPAIFWLTGSEFFTSHLRKAASNKGYRITMFAVRPILEKQAFEPTDQDTQMEEGGAKVRYRRGPKPGNEKVGEPIKPNDEKDIFEAIEMNYVPPDQRN